MDRYDPMTEPDPDEWLALDEQERIHLIAQYHKKMKIRLPNVQVHAAFAAIVENQCALRDQTPVKVTLDRLVREGLDRHDAIHAVGMVLIEHMQNIRNGDVTDDDINRPYFDALETTSAKKWLDYA